MELLPLGPVVIIDTPGLDDEGELGLKRVEKAKQVLAKTDIAVLVVDSALGLSELDKELIKEFKSRKISYLVAYNKIDIGIATLSARNGELPVSAKTGQGINELKEKLGTFAKFLKNEKHLVSDLLSPKDLVVLVIPIDESAPKGRLIMPQQMVIRDLLDKHCTIISSQVEELKDTLESLKVSPKLVITDSQAFKEVSKIVPENIYLTSFSILMARYKGDLSSLLNGVNALSHLQNGDKVLIAEGCVHHRQCNDIGTKKIPNWIENYSKAKPDYQFVSGGDFPSNLSQYKLIVHCGGCMLNETEMKNRINKANESNIPIVNYGMAIAQMNGILSRSLKILNN
jgi:[FeFe] hydrogenase H-cluster maturation GTPase HydF